MRWRHRVWVCLALSGAGCGWLDSGVACLEAEQVLVASAEPLTCGDVEPIKSALSILAGKPIEPKQARLVNAALVAEYPGDPAKTRARIAKAEEIRSELGALSGLEAAKARSHRLFEAVSGDGMFQEADTQLMSVQRRMISVWAQNDEHRLVLSGADVEGWIRYASLCREVQGGSPLRLSVVQREKIYRTVIERFEEGGEAHQVSMLAFGAFWPSVESRWQAASYEEQRAWIDAAPLPPPMTATSLGYAAAILEQDPKMSARIFHEQIGPLTLSGVD